MYLLSVFMKLAVCVYFNVLFCAICVESEENEKIDDCRFSSEARNGSFSLPFEKNCDVYVYIIDCSKTSSIISISTEAEDAKDSSGDKSIVVTFNETLDNGAKSLVSISQWIITPQNAKDGHFYFSRTSQLQVEITVKGNWSRIPLKFVSDEVEFNGYDRSSEDSSGEVKPWESIKGRDYRPNSVFLFRINGHDVNSIDIVLEDLDIDEAIGEYLLIGSGTGPFEGPPPLFISKQLQEKKYKIFNGNAYIVFVTSATRSNHTGFKITWKHDETKAPDEDGKEHLRQDDVLQSVQVCIYNKTAALAEFNKTDPFLKFRKEISEIASMYAKENNLLSEYTNITSSQVEIFRVSDVIRENEADENLRAGGFYVMMKIKGPEIGSAAFRWNELEKIIHKYYSANHSAEYNEYKISRCPRSGVPSKWTNIAFYAIIPILCCLFLVIWASRQSRFADMFSKKVKGAALQLQTTSHSAAEVHAENLYETTVPKVRVTNDQGRRYTLTFNDTAAKSTDEDSEVEVYNRDHFKRPSIMNETRSARNQKLPFQQGETNAAFVEDEAGNSSSTLQRTSPVLDTQPNETEHFYDTVKSAKGSGKGNAEDETKM